MQKTTESDSYYNNLENMSIHELLSNMNKEDKTVPNAVEKVIPQIEKLTEVYRGAKPNFFCEILKHDHIIYLHGIHTEGRLLTHNLNFEDARAGLPVRVRGVAGAGIASVKKMCSAHF